MRNLLFLAPAMVVAVLPLAAKDYFESRRLERHVITHNGTTEINGLPTIMQKRSFCAPASVEMILHYYGIRFDQKKLAKLFDTSRKTGTSTLNLQDEFQRGKLNDVKFTVLYQLSDLTLKKMIAVYIASGAASSGEKKKLQKPQADLDEVYECFDARKSREIFFPIMGNVSNVLIESLYKFVAGGRPLLWSVRMELDPRDRAKGGHMRVIFGFIEKKGQIEKIIYADPWGREHRRKIMDFEDAVVETTGLYLIEENK